MTAVLGWLRGLFAVGLLAGFYVVASALLVTDVALVAAMLWLMVEAPSRAGNWSLVLGGSIPAAVALLYGIATVSRTEEHPPAAVLVSRAEAPGLWRLVEDLAGRLRTRPPDRIYLTPEANASVSEKARLLGFAVGDRTMYLGVPLLRWLKPMELRAVLCHELGHYAGRHTRFGALTYRGAAALGSTLFRLRMTAWSEEARSGYAWLFHSVISCYGWLYFRLSLAVRRRQELEADAEAVAAVGPAVTADALRAVHALAITWAGFESRYLRPVQRLGFAPEDVFEAFAAMLDDPCVRERTADLREHPVEAGRSPLDSHPPLARRLALIEARPAGDTPDVVDDGPLVTADRLVQRVRQSMLDKAGGPVTELSVTTWADLAAEAFAVELASLLLDAARGLGITARPTLATVLDRLERGEPTELIRRLTDAPEPEEQLAEALYALTGQALAGAGRARWTLSWTHGYLLDCPQDPARRLEDLVAAAVRSRAGVHALRRELARLGLDTEAPVVLALRTVAAPAGRTTVPRTTRRAPDLVLGELARQRKVAKVTVGALIATGAVWGIALIGTDPPQPYRPTFPTAAAPQYSPAPQPTLPLPTRPGLDIPLPTPSLSFTLPLPGFPYRIHRVVHGDTLTGIACRYGTTVEALQEYNDMGRRTGLIAGQQLLVPESGRAGCR
ncbi:M48 family metalloprotease [Streptomyces scopuliridis]|uniref:M48 family metalloprotease n=1 Tax=Streptomyces scopuliridis TaxID=452529 RepID=A0ACD4ZWZ0_9ACTN|nr:M48 family metalloprotease [Streptomyces scopuliridis]WSC02808.1 M48 family metalloprotease [Streptomyces scopuliridis]WSC03658.1 M48 family metalloprotease [Streptomyces scopuliridis]